MHYSEVIEERIKELDTNSLSPIEQHLVIEKVSNSSNDIPNSLKQSLQEAQHKMHKTLLQLFQISTIPLDDWYSLLNNTIRIPTDSNWSRLPDEQVTFILTFTSQIYSTLTSIYNSESVFALDLSKSVLCYNGNKLTGLQVESDKMEFAVSCGLVHYSLDRLFARTTDDIIKALSCPDQKQRMEEKGTCLSLVEYINNYIDKWNKFNDDCLRNPLL